MQPWFFMMLGLAVVLAADPKAPGNLWACQQKGCGGCFGPLLGEGAEITVQALLLTAVYFFGIVLWLPAAEAPVYALFLLPAAYSLSWIRKKSDRFALVVFGISLFVAAKGEAVPPARLLLLLIRVALGITVTRILLAGCADRLRISFTPEQVKGLPVFFLTAAFIGLALCGFSGISP